MAKLPNIDYIKCRKYCFGFSALVIIITSVWAFINGIDMAIEFKGGTLIQYSYSGDIDSNEAESVIEGFIKENVSITQGENFSDGNKSLTVSFVSDKGLTADTQYDLTSKLQEKFPDNQIKVLTSSDVSPTSGKLFFIKCLVAVLFASILIIIYIALRFKKIGGWSAGVCAVIALLHDVFFVFATFVFVKGFDIDANFMACALTILGYSINDTIVIYDRIRENKRIMGRNTDIRALVNTSTNQSLSRSIITSLTTITAMAVVAVVAFSFNINSILSFALPMIVGMISGTYSSIFIACPLWVWWMEKKSAKA